MALGRGLHRRGRYDNVRRIEELDPEVDQAEILHITSRLDFPWDYGQGTGIAFMRDYGVPSISGLLHRTGEFERHGIKRYDDTILIGQEATIEGLDSPRGHAAMRRFNKIHGHYDIPDHEFAYVLATTIVGPVRWIGAYGWRPLHPHELTAMVRVTTRFGELIGLRDLPDTYDGYLRLLTDYEREHFAYHPDNTALADATIEIGKATAPAPLKPLMRRVTIALFDEPLRIALGMPKQPDWFVSAVRGGLRWRGRLLRWFATPRTEAVYHQAITYPEGHTLSMLGPTHMLDALNRSNGSTPSDAASPHPSHPESKETHA